jgi:hypothetical protein
VNDAALAWNREAAGVYDVDRERPASNACSRPMFAL